MHWRPNQRPSVTGLLEARPYAFKHTRYQRLAFPCFPYRLQKSPRGSKSRGQGLSRMKVYRTGHPGSRGVYPTRCLSLCLPSLRHDGQIYAGYWILVSGGIGANAGFPLTGTTHYYQFSAIPKISTNPNFTLYSEYGLKTNNLSLSCVR